jgi:L-threonylcarbamoyladenylate synthase
LSGDCVLWHWGDPVAPLRRLIERSGIVAIPTESSYGLAVSPTDERAVAAIYAVKGREGGKPLPVVVADLDQARRLGVDLEAPQLAPLLSLWPAPLTLVAPLRAPLAASGAANGLAIRIPAHRRLRYLLRDLGFGLTATSANLSGEPAIVDPRRVVALLEGRSAAVVDDGTLPGGPPSTIVGWDGVELRLLREGALPAAELPPTVRRAAG